MSIFDIDTDQPITKEVLLDMGWIEITESYYEIPVILYCNDIMPNQTEHDYNIFYCLKCTYNLNSNVLKVTPYNYSLQFNDTECFSFEDINMVIKNILDLKIVTNHNRLKNKIIVNRIC